jgi:RNA polymerase sigma-70 factor (ECF subfamily)
MDGLGRDDGFEGFFRQTLDDLVLFLMRVGASWGEAEDAAQEAMALAYQNWHGLKRPTAWVRVVAWRIHVRSAVRAREALEHLHKASWLNVAGAADSELKLFGDDERLVINALRRLPLTQRLVMAWSYDGYSPAEIAIILGKRPETVRSDLRHARARLKQLLLDSEDQQLRWPSVDLSDLAGAGHPVNEPSKGVEAAITHANQDNDTDCEIVNTDAIGSVQDLACRPMEPVEPSTEVSDQAPDSARGGPA